MSKAFCGDNDGSRVFCIDLQSWTRVEVKTDDGPYPVDKISATEVLASTRRENSVTRIGISSPHQTDTIPLTHMPRSATAHSGGKPLVLVSGADQACTTVLDLSAGSASGWVVGSRNTAAVADWTCNGFVPVAYLIMPSWLRTRAG